MGVQKRRGIVIACGHHNMFAAGRGQLGQKVVVKFLSAVARRGGIENITGDQEDIDGSIPDGLDQPIEENLEFLITRLVVERSAQVPIGSV